MVHIPEFDNFSFDKLPLKDIDSGREEVEKSPTASFFTSPQHFTLQQHNFATPIQSSKAHNGIQPISSIGSSRFNQLMNSPCNVGTPLDFSSFVNSNSFQNALVCDSLSPHFTSPNGVQAPDSFI
eukprot:TRINITY_DN4480_c0_g1_i1.p2 TRINITY_DN4480_c0_g1~~TRINITY_DN4480_c0_g1_i1.p2  ORF type:complete len:125 (+),score=15.47 TRINITY_DN4480_c0_g1_i1:1186-1560(+)